MALRSPPELDYTKILPLLTKISTLGSAATASYLHWDELRHRKPPADLTTEDWWQVTRWARRASQRTLPLIAVDGTPFSFVMADQISKLVHEIDRDASGRLELPEQVTNESTRDRYIVSSLIQEAITSSQLEGASTTRQVAEQMLRAGRAPRNEGERMIVDNYRAMGWVRKHVSVPLSVEAVLELQSLVTAETIEPPDAAGRFRRDDERIAVVDFDRGETVHVPPAAASLTERVQAMCQFANASDDDSPFIHPLIRAIIVHLWLAYDHPFVDGNGRTARALFYWSMLRRGYWLTEFLSISTVIHESRRGYDRVFQLVETDAFDATYFLIHQLEVIRKAIDQLLAHLREETEGVRAVESKLQGRLDLHRRQIELLSHALRHPESEYTVERHQRTHGVTHQTARTDLLALAKLGYLQQGKVGRKFVFRVPSDLSRRLRARR